MELHQGPIRRRTLPHSARRAQQRCSCGEAHAMMARVAENPAMRRRRRRESNFPRAGGRIGKARWTRAGRTTASRWGHPTANTRPSSPLQTEAARPMVMRLSQTSQMTTSSQVTCTLLAKQARGEVTQCSHRTKRIPWATRALCALLDSERPMASTRLLARGRGQYRGGQSCLTPPPSRLPISPQSGTQESSSHCLHQHLHAPIPKVPTLSSPRGGSSSP
mmetsp:Transcript_22760/g.36399  ORF Transcript_22760/g.36399 Transcript_22760/m.36399 type:complete len:220 (-) Transcript_22760:1470-2129(-)